MAREHLRPAEMEDLVVGDVGALLLDGEDDQAVALGRAEEMALYRQVPMIEQDPALVIGKLGQQRRAAREHLDLRTLLPAAPPEQAALIEQHQADLGHQTERRRVAAEGRVGEVRIAGRVPQHGEADPLPAQCSHEVPGAEIGGPDLRPPPRRSA